VKICHSYREANSWTYALANMGREHASELRVYKQCPARLSSLVLVDVVRIATPSLFSFLFSLLIYILLLSVVPLLLYLNLYLQNSKLI